MARIPSIKISMLPFSRQHFETSGRCTPSPSEFAPAPLLVGYAEAVSRVTVVSHEQHTICSFFYCSEPATTGPRLVRCPLLAGKLDNISMVIYAGALMS